LPPVLLSFPARRSSDLLATSRMVVRRLSPNPIKAFILTSSCFPVRGRPGPEPGPRPASAFDGARQDAPDEVPLEGKEDRHGHGHGDEGGRGQEAPALAAGAPPGAAVDRQNRAR